MIFSLILFSHELYNFSKITFHTSSNCDKKKQWISRILKYQFCLFKKKCDTQDKTNHHDVSTLRRDESFGPKGQNCDTTMIQRIHTYYWFTQHVFFYCSNSSFDHNNVCFFYFICMFFHNKMLITMMSWMYNWNSQIFKMNHFINVNEKTANPFNALTHYEIIDCLSCFFLFSCLSFFIFFGLIFLFLCCHADGDYCDRRSHNTTSTQLAANGSVIHALRFYARGRHFFHIRRLVGLFFKHASRIVLK